MAPPAMEAVSKALPAPPPPPSLIIAGEGQLEPQGISDDSGRPIMHVGTLLCIQWKHQEGSAVASFRATCLDSLTTVGQLSN